MLDQRGRFANARDFVTREAVEKRGEVRDATLASALHDAAPPRRRVQAVNTTIGAVAYAPDESVCLERLHDARHRRRADLLGRRKLRERARPAEDEHRQRRELGRRHAGCRILAPHVAQRMDCRRVEAVRRFD